MTRNDAITNLKIIKVAFVEPVTEEQITLIDETFNIAIKALEQEPCDYYDTYNKTCRRSEVPKESCDDCISRQAVINAIYQNCIYENEYNLTAKSIKEAVEKLPSVTPKAESEEEE